MLAAAALILLTLLFQTGEEVNWFEFGLFLALFGVAESRPVWLPKKRLIVTVTFIMVIVGIIHMPPVAVALACGLCIVTTRTEGKWLSPPKLVFNSAQYALAGGLAALTYGALGGTRGIEQSELLPLIAATGAATGIYFLINSAAVSGAIALSTHSSFVKTWITSHGWLAATYVAFGAFGIVLASLYQVVSFAAVPLLFVPLLVAKGAFRSYQEVSEAYDSTVRAFVRAIEAKDTYTRGHSERVAEYAKWIAERMGMREPELEVFYYGALLHDVGKVAIRKSVLNKPGRLDPEEWEEIKRHPVLGAQIVREIDFLRPALDAVLYHHERLDGTGYPAGLMNSVVPVWPRILGVADTYDAMTSDRAYRRGSSSREAIDELLRCSGNLLDEDCVNTFIEALKEQKQTTEREFEGAYEAQAAAGAAG